MSDTLILLLAWLLPGIVGIMIVDQLIIHKDWNQFKFILFSSIYGITCYLILEMILFLLKLAFEIDYKLSIWNLPLNLNGNIYWYDILFSLPISIVFAFVLTNLINLKLINKFSSWLNISNKFGDENLYYFFLNSPAIQWIYIRDIKNNLTYQGKVKSFSENTIIKEILLTDVSVYTYEDSKFLYEVPTIYLSFNHDNVIIEQIPASNFKDKSNE